MLGDIMTISRLRMGTDGKGVTTLVAFFGCPLNCKYCINDFCHRFSTKRVPRGAYTPEELINVLEKDDIYYRMSGGGVTFGGGEPLLQSDFIHQVCCLMQTGWMKRIETSLNVPWKKVKPLLKDIDEWIIDIKDLDAEIYETYTGVEITNLVENICKLSAKVDLSKLRIRVPRIPGYNDEDNIRNSVSWIREVIKVEPEVFDYYETAEICTEIQDDILEYKQKKAKEAGDRNGKQ